jgi:L-amino acid N-acyltransferase YncA
MEVRPATEGDLEAVARIYNEGIEDRVATFDTEPVAGEQLAPWLSAKVPMLVADDRGFARAGPYSDREAYAGIGEAMVYVARSARGSGVGRALVEALCGEAEARGLHKLIAKVFPENEPSVRLMERCGFRRVGVHLRHGRLEGEWRDVLLLERSLGT